MNTNVRSITVTSREFFRSPRKIAGMLRGGKRIVVTRNGEEFFEVVPTQPRRRKTIADFEHLIFSDPKGDRDMSKKVDEIVYGDL